MYHRQRFPIVVNMGNGLGQSLFLRVTQEDRPASLDNDFPLWLTWGMVRLEVGAGQSFPLEMVRTVIP
jgi:hypothetical protein